VLPPERQLRRAQKLELREEQRRKSAAAENAAAVNG
jgi:UPF0176 protein